MNGSPAPLWLPPLLLLGLCTWIFVWYFAINYLIDLGVADYEHGIRIPQPAWKSALSYALSLPAILIAGLGCLGIGALIIGSVGSIVAS